MLCPYLLLQVLPTEVWAPFVEQRGIRFVFYFLEPCCPGGVLEISVEVEEADEDLWNSAPDIADGAEEKVRRTDRR